MDQLSRAASVVLLFALAIQVGAWLLEPFLPGLIVLLALAVVVTFMLRRRL